MSIDFDKWLITIPVITLSIFKSFCYKLQSDNIKLITLTVTTLSGFYLVLKLIYILISRPSCHSKLTLRHCRFSPPSTSSSTTTTAKRSVPTTKSSWPEVKRRPTNRPTTVTSQPTKMMTRTRKRMKTKLQPHLFTPWNQQQASCCFINL